MTTNESKAGLKKNTFTTNAESKVTPESKFTEEPQSNLNSSESGQLYEIIENTPFAAVKQGEVWRIVIGNMIASPYEFTTKEAVEDYVKKRPWELIWTMAMWLINNQEKFITKTKE